MVRRERQGDWGHSGECEGREKENAWLAGRGAEEAEVGCETGQMRKQEMKGKAEGRGGGRVRWLTERRRFFNAVWYRFLLCTVKNIAKKQIDRLSSANRSIKLYIQYAQGDRNHPPDSLVPPPPHPHAYLAPPNWHEKVDRRPIMQVKVGKQKG
jgi:hypothetical protein